MVMMQWWKDYLAWDGDDDYNDERATNLAYFDDDDDDDDYNEERASNQPALFWPRAHHQHRAWSRAEPPF